MKKNSLILFALIFLFLVFTLISNIINYGSQEQIRGAIRLTFSYLLILIISKKIFPIKLAWYFFIVANLNAVLVILQGIDHINEFLPDFLESKNFVFGEFRPSFRNTGFLYGFQISSFFSALALIVIDNFKISKLTKALIIIILTSSILLGSRTILVSLIIYSFFNYTKIDSLARRTIPIVFIGLILIGSMNQVTRSFLELRLGFILDIFKFELTDYSAQESISFFKKLYTIDLKTFLIGNGRPQYGPYGGSDPFYLKQIFQNGFIALFLLFTLISITIWKSKFELKTKVSVFLIFLISSIKGELFTGLLSFEILMYLLNAKEKVSLRHT